MPVYGVPRRIPSPKRHRSRSFFPTAAAPPGGGPATYTSHVTLAAPRNGTAAHTVHPDGTGGTVVDGTAFTPTAGRLLVCFVEGAVTSTTPTGWTLPISGSAIDQTGLYVFYRASASGTSADQIATTHNGSNYPIVFDFYEFEAGSTFGSAASATAVAFAGGAGPTLSGLTGTNWTAGVVGVALSSGDTFTGIAWNGGVEEVETSAAFSTTDGYAYSLTYTQENIASSQAYAATLSGTGLPTVERLVVAINAVATGGGTTPVTSSVATGWAVRAQTTKTTATTWNVAAQVSKTLANSWNVRAAISQTVAQSWAVKTAVTKTLAQSWMVDTGPYLTAAYQVDSAGSDQTTLTTPTFTPAAGEVIVVKAQSQFGDGNAFPTPSGGGLTYTLQQSSVGVASHDRVALWTAVVGGSPSSMAISLGSPGAVNNYHSMVAERYTEARLAATPATMVATSSSAGAPSGIITTAANDSKVSWLNSDWNSVDGVSRAYSTTSATPKETGYRFVSGAVTFYWAQQRAVTAGSQTIGLTAPTGQNWSLAGVEIQKATGLTSVTNTLAETWAVRAQATQTVATTWNVRAEVVKTLAQSWAVKVAINKTVAEGWTVRATVSQTTAQSWNVRAQATGTLATTWGVGGKITTTLAQVWAVKAAVSQTTVQSWAVRAAVSKTVATAWDVRAEATKTLATTWGVGGKVTTTLAQAWAVKAVVSQTTAQSWAVQAAVSKTVAESWAVRAQATKTVATTWGVGGKVTTTVAITWGVGGRVTGTAATTWNVATSLTKTLAQSWAVRVAVSKSTATTWNLRAFATGTKAVSWNVGARTTGTLATAWAVKTVLTKTLVQSWAVRAGVTKTLAEGWAVRAWVAATLELAWDVDVLSQYPGPLWAVYPNIPTWDVDALEPLWGVRIGQNLWTVKPIKE